MDKIQKRSYSKKTEDGRGSGRSYRLLDRTQQTRRIQLQSHEEQVEQGTLAELLT